MQVILSSKLANVLFIKFPIDLPTYLGIINHLPSTITRNQLLIDVSQVDVISFKSK